MFSRKISSAIGLITVISVFIIVVIVNDNNSQEELADSVALSSQRGIASSPVVSQNLNDSFWKKRIAMQISETSGLPSAKLARQPNPIENLVFGELKGYYLMKLDGEKVNGLLLNTQNMSEDVPQYFGEELSFLEKNRQLWSIDFHDLAIKKRESHSSVISLLDGLKKEIGMAEFSWDSMGHMTSLKIEKK